MEIKWLRNALKNLNHEAEFIAKDNLMQRDWSSSVFLKVSSYWLKTQTWATLGAYPAHMSW